MICLSENHLDGNLVVLTLIYVKIFFRNNSKTVIAVTLALCHIQQHCIKSISAKFVPVSRHLETLGQVYFHSLAFWSMPYKVKLLEQ